MTWHVDDGLWSLTCDDCGDGWYDWDGDLRFEFRRDMEAFAQLNGWVIGSTGAICPSCGLAALCSRVGHRWGPWTNLDPSPLVGGLGAQRLRFCEVCSTGQYLPSPGG